jgi:hypothetical protein
MMCVPLSYCSFRLGETNAQINKVLVDSPVVCALCLCKYNIRRSKYFVWGVSVPSVYISYVQLFFQSIFFAPSCYNNRLQRKIAETFHNMPFKNRSKIKSVLVHKTEFRS